MAKKPNFPNFEPEKQEPKMDKIQSLPAWVKRSLITSVIGGILFIFTYFILVDVVWIRGNEMGVHESWFSGLDPTPVQPGIHFYFPGFAHDVIHYDMSSQIYVMNNKPDKPHKMKKDEEFGEGREVDAYTVQSTEGQSMVISLSLRWRPNPDHLVDLHRTVRHSIEEKILRNTLIGVVKNKATTRKAIDAYSGEGLVRLQQDIEHELTDPKGSMSEKGIIVENFVVEAIDLDPNYITEIKTKQIAVQRELRAKQEQIAALAEAEKAKAEAQADYNRKVVEAERDKQTGILAAEKSAEQQVIAAEADKKRQVLAAEAEKDSSELRAQAILAIGKAEADAKKMQLLAYGAEGSDNFVRIEVAKSMAEAFKNISGYLPSDMKINVLTSNFMESLNSFLSNRKDTKQ